MHQPASTIYQKHQLSDNMEVKSYIIYVQLFQYYLNTPDVLFKVL